VARFTSTSNHPNWFGPLLPFGVHAIAIGQSIARVTFEGAAPPKGRSVVSRKKFVCEGPKPHVLLT